MKTVKLPYGKNSFREVKLPENAKESESAVVSHETILELAAHPELDKDVPEYLLTIVAKHRNVVEVVPVVAEVVTPSALEEIVIEPYKEPEEEIVIAEPDFKATKKGKK